jgi:signal transduction histidine kinase
VRLPAAVAVAAFRIAVEAMADAIRHSAARRLHGARR